MSPKLFHLRARALQDMKVFEALLDAADPDLILVDAGAKGGVHDLSRVARHVRAFGFEPNPDELRSLVDGGALGPPYKELDYSSSALMGVDSDTTLFISRRPGATSTLEPNSELLRHFERDNWSQMQEIVGTASIHGMTLSSFMQRVGLDRIDLLKLDTQGNECDILNSAERFLDRVSVVKTEVELVPIYRNQSLIGEVCSFMANNDFELLDIRSVPECRRFHFDPDLPKDSYRLVWADAIFVRRPYDFEKLGSFQQSVVLAELGYLDLALFILENIRTIRDDLRAGFIEHYRRRPASLSDSPTRRFLYRHASDWLLNLRSALQDHPRSKQVVRL